jgi:prolactin regulatory element-binding protein
MTKTVWSPFYKPDSATGKTFVPYLRLASTSLANTVSVETFELQPSGSRHVLQTRQSRVLQSAATYSVIAIIGLALALLIQSVLDPEGRLTQGLVPKSLQNAAVKTFGEAHRDQRHAAVLNNANSPAIKVERRIRDILHLHNPPSGSGLPQSEKALIIHHDPDTDGALSTEVHDDHEAVLKKHDAAKKWDDLSAEDQLAWKTKLTDAGMWAVDEGETILKSIFFGQIGGLVGQVAQGVLG